jgi:twitching motility two-component system response regulator PilH
MTGKTILLVDDSPAQLRLLQQALAGRGYQLMTAADGEEALAKVSEQRPDLILLDIILPKKNGFQVCRQIKTSPDTKNTKILLVSNKSQDSDRFWGLKQGADGYVTRPFNSEELAASVARHL